MLNVELLVNQPLHSSKFQKLLERFPYPFPSLFRRSPRLGAAKLQTLFFLDKYFFIFFEKIFPSRASKPWQLSAAAPLTLHLLKKREGKDTNSFASTQVFFYHLMLFFCYRLKTSGNAGFKAC